MKFRLVEDIQDNKVTLEVKFEVYGRYGDGGEIITAKVSGKDLRHALMRMVDKMRLYIDSDDIEEKNLTAEQILDSISESNGDGCDMIYLLKNLTTNEVLIDCSDCYIEQDWDDDFDESLKETLDMSLEELQRTADRYLNTGIDELMRTILNNTNNMTRDQLSRLVRLCRNFYALLEEFASNTIAESFSNNFESRDLQDTGELISALKELIKEYGHMELEKEVYLETVENDHGRQLKIGYQQINEDADPELTKKIANIRQQALEYVLDRLSDFYMSEYDQEERIKHANNIVDMIVRIYPEMTDYVQYWGAGETEIDKLWHEGVREDVTDELYNNFPESVITDYLYAKKILRDD